MVDLLNWLFTFMTFRNNSLQIFQLCQHICEQRHLTAILFHTRFSRIFVQKNTLKYKDNVSLCNGQQVSLFFGVIKIMSPSRANIRQVCLLPIIKYLGYLSSVFFSCDTNLLCMQYLPGPLCIILMGVGDREDRHNCKVQFP